MASARSAPQTFAGAVCSSTLRIHARGAGVAELASAGATGTKLGSLATSARLDEDLVVLDPLRPGPIASRTRRHKVLSGVVRPVIVKMVNDQHSSSWACTRLPVDHHLAPVTGMRSGTDAVVELDSVFSDETTGGSKGMFGQDELSAHIDLGLGDALVPADGRAERPVPEVAWRSGYCNPTVLARLGNRHRNLPDGERELTLLQR